MTKEEGLSLYIPLIKAAFTKIVDDFEAQIIAHTVKDQPGEPDEHDEKDDARAN